MVATEAGCREDLLPGVEAVGDGEVAQDRRPLPGEGEDRERPSARFAHRGLARQPLADPGVHGAARHVEVPVEAGLGQLPEGDAAVDSHVGERPLGAVARRGRLPGPASFPLPLLPVTRGDGTPGLRHGGPRVLEDRAVTHSPPSFMRVSVAACEAPSGDRERTLRPQRRSSRGSSDPGLRRRLDRLEYPARSTQTFPGPLIMSAGIPASSSAASRPGKKEPEVPDHARTLHSRPSSLSRQYPFSRGR